MIPKPLMQSQVKKVADMVREDLRLDHALQIFLSIEFDPSVPDALSQHQLKAFLKAAAEDAHARADKLDEDDLLRAALSAWADQTRELLMWLESQGDALGRTRTPKQVMALGSLRTHMVMGLKALKYAEG